MSVLRSAITEFYTTEIYQSYAKEEKPRIINSGLCGEFAQYVIEHHDSNLRKMTTADIIGVADSARPDPWHVWLTDGEKHYDAENPEGVRTWRQLNYFQRTLV